MSVHCTMYIILGFTFSAYSWAHDKIIISKFIVLNKKIVPFVMIKKKKIINTNSIIKSKNDLKFNRLIQLVASAWEEIDSEKKNQTLNC